MDESQLKRLEKVEESFQKHVEHYMQNNKALALLSNEMKYFNKQFTEHKVNEERYQQRIDSHLSSLEAVVDKLNSLDLEAAKDVMLSYRGFMSVKNVVVGLGAFVIALGAIGGFFMYLIKHTLE